MSFTIKIDNVTGATLENWAIDNDVSLQELVNQCLKEKCAQIIAESPPITVITEEESNTLELGRYNIFLEWADAIVIQSPCVGLRVTIAEVLESFKRYLTETKKMEVKMHDSELRRFLNRCFYTHYNVRQQSFRKGARTRRGYRYMKLRSQDY